MKKCISVLSTVALISTVFFTLLSVYLGFYYLLSTVYGEISITGDLLTMVAIRIAKALLLLCFNAIVALYLLLKAGKTKSYKTEIVLSALRFAAYPLLSAVVSTVETHIYQSVFSASSSAVLIQQYSAFSAGMGNAFNVLDFSCVLLIFALAFSIAQKAIEKKQDEEAAPERVPCARS